MGIAGRKRRYPKCHHAVSNVFVNEAIMSMNDRRNCTKIAVQQVDNRGRCKLLANPRKILYVGKEDCKSATFGMLCTAVDEAANNSRI